MVTLIDNDEKLGTGANSGEAISVRRKLHYMILEEKVDKHSRVTRSKRVLTHIVSGFATASLFLLSGVDNAWGDQDTSPNTQPHYPWEKTSDKKTSSDNEYVGMGDSRAAIPQNMFGSMPCNRSKYSNPDLVARILHIQKVRNVSCVQAKIRNLYEPQKMGLLGVPPQLQAITSNTRLVTLAIGGNDIGWYRQIKTCFTPVLGQDARCRYNDRLREHINHSLSVLRPRLVAVLETIHHRAPNAQVFLIGHGGYYGEKGCKDIAQSSSEDLQWINNAFFRAFNIMMAQSARETNSSFIDISIPAIGHDSCKPKNVAWFTGNVSRNGTPTRHPTPAGSIGEARVIAHNILLAQQTGKLVLPNYVDQQNPLENKVQSSPKQGSQVVPQPVEQEPQQSDESTHETEVNGR